MSEPEGTNATANAMGRSAPDWLARLSAARRRHWLALGLLLVCGALLWTSERGRSLTADEPLHLIRGHAFWWNDTAHLSYAHPPLGNAITSLPYAGSGTEPWGPRVGTDGKERKSKLAAKPRYKVMPKLKGWDTADPLRVASAYFRHDFVRARAELTGARRMMMLWTLVLAGFLYVWVERRYGWTAAIIALALFSLHPTLLAHGRLVTTDMPLVATAFASLAATIAWIERPSWQRVVWFGLATTAMVLSKHSGLAFVVVLSLIVLGAAALGRGGFAPTSGSDTARARLHRTALVAGQLTLVAVLMIMALAVIYRYDRVGLTVAQILAEPEPHNWLSKKHDYELLAASPIADLPDELRLPFPYTWLAGLATVADQNDMGHGGYFFGMNAKAGHPLYFPVLLFAKSPTGLLVLLTAGAGLLITRLRHGLRPSLTTVVLAIFAGVTLASACASHINIGVRHVLPLIPVMIVFAARSGQLLIAGASARLGQRWGAGLVLACVLGCGAGAASTFPTWLGDFNLLVGGPTGGHQISVIGEDWGQDLGDLGKLAKSQGWERIVYFNRFPLRREELEVQGLEVQKLSCKKPYRGPDPVVIHLSDWERSSKCFKWLEGREPSFVVNHHMLVFVD